MKIILDTNFLVYCAKQKIDYIEEIDELIKGNYEIVVPDLVKQELIELKEKAKKYSDREAASLALQILKTNKIKVIKIKAKNTDQGIIKISKENIVATLDFILRKKIKKNIVINRKNKLVLL